MNLLNEIVKDAAQFSGYDIIVDDGGHKSSQMLASFRVSPRASLSRANVLQWGPYPHIVFI